MKCPKCKKAKWTLEVPDAGFMLYGKRLVKIPGFYCEDCCMSWFTVDCFKRKGGKNV